MQPFARILSRNLITISLVSLALFAVESEASAAMFQTHHANRLPITDAGAVGDGQTLNTTNIQAAIDQLAGKGGGTLVIPHGVFVSGAIFLKPGVNLYLEEGAVLKGSTDTNDYPAMMTRIEGHFVKWLPAFINADKVDHLRISGSGVLDGSGAPFWQEFWDQRKHATNVTNLGVPRPRLMFIQNSKDVQISGVTFTNSAFWNLHLYRCKNVVVENATFEALHLRPPNRAPSSDAIDVDSCQRVTVRGCTFAIADDCVCLKGSKGPFALQDKDSPPTEHILVTGCTFKAGDGAVTLGSEATVIRDVVVENCSVTGIMPLVRVKVRPDTPQDYEDIHYRNITLTGGRAIFEFRPWTQFFDLQGQPAPKSVVKNITVSDIKGSADSFGEISGKPETAISDITLKNIDVQLKNGNLKAVNVKNLKIKNVKVNGTPFSLDAAKEKAAP
jgi:polygalacturonase